MHAPRPMGFVSPFNAHPRERVLMFFWAHVSILVVHRLALGFNRQCLGSAASGGFFATANPMGEAFEAAAHCIGAPVVQHGSSRLAQLGCSTMSRRSSPLKRLINGTSSSHRRLVPGFGAKLRCSCTQPPKHPPMPKLKTTTNFQAHGYGTWSGQRMRPRQHSNCPKQEAS